MTASLATACWADLPLDLVGSVSDRLCDAADFVRLHAVCRAWHATAAAALAPATASTSGPAFPPTRPWILAPSSGVILQYPFVTLRRMATPPKRSCHRRCHNEGTKSGDRNWVASADGKAAWLFTGGPDPKLTDLITGAITPLPPFPDDDEIQKAMEKPRGIVYGDGTILLYSLSPPKLHYYGHRFTVAILHPDNGDTAAWTVVKQSLPVQGSHCFGATYHRHRDGAGGRLLLWIGVYCYCYVCSVQHVKGVTAAAGECPRRTRLDMTGGNFVCDYNYYLVSRGELLWTTVIVEREWYHSADKDDDDPPPRAVSLAVYALKPAVGGRSNRMEWVRKEGRSLGDRVLFLGSPASFTVDDVAQLSGGGGGYAYFVFKQGVYSYNLVDGQAKLAAGKDRLSPHWGSDKVFMWLQTQPTIASIQEIRERLKASSKKKDVVH